MLSYFLIYSLFFRWENFPAILQPIIQPGRFVSCRFPNHLQYRELIECNDAAEDYITGPKLGPRTALVESVSREDGGIQIYEPSSENGWISEGFLKIEEYMVYIYNYIIYIYIRAYILYKLLEPFPDIFFGTCD